MNFDGTNTTTINLAAPLKIDMKVPHYTLSGEKLPTDVIRDNVPVVTEINVISQGGCNVALPDFTLDVGKVNGCNYLKISIGIEDPLTCTDMSNTTPK